MKMSIRGEDLRKLDKRYKKMSRQTKRDLRDLASVLPLELFQNVLMFMNGPGPNIVTGAYVSSFQAGVDIRRTTIGAWLSNDSPQAARLEFGFYGIDSLGRNYSQAPRPHMRPALIETQLWYLDRAISIIEEALG